MELVSADRGNSLSVNCLDSSVITTLKTAHNMSASTEGYNQPYLINSENRCGALCLYRSVNGS